MIFLFLRYRFNYFVLVKVCGNKEGIYSYKIWV